ncbi:hypothetical protein HG530_013682 [Fusarium avenaceum]|nr:hypothetical protein HG530_013682 [Fusarium avenaceum]
MASLVRRSAGDIAPHDISAAGVFTAHSTSILRYTVGAQEVAADKRLVIGGHGWDDSIGCVNEEDGAFSDGAGGSKKPALARVLVWHQMRMHVKVQVAEGWAFGTPLVR